MPWVWWVWWLTFSRSLIIRAAIPSRANGTDPRNPRNPPSTPDRQTPHGDPLPQAAGLHGDELRREIVSKVDDAVGGVMGEPVAEDAALDLSAPTGGGHQRVAQVIAVACGLDGLARRGRVGAERLAPSVQDAGQAGSAPDRPLRSRSIVPAGSPAPSHISAPRTVSDHISKLWSRGGRFGRPAT